MAALLAFPIKANQQTNLIEQTQQDVYDPNHSETRPFATEVHPRSFPPSLALHGSQTHDVHSYGRGLRRAGCLREAH